MDNKQKISKEMDEFLDKVDRLCWEYGFQIIPNANKLENDFDTIIVTDGENETIKIMYIDGDGRGK